MADQPRGDLSRPSERATGAGEPKVEQLLLAGLDYYFAGEYERAISVWTRALFLDRNHARARAYIERARAAIAERQRESEELMQRGVAAFGRGDAAEARMLLETAIERGGPHDVAFAFLDRLDRLQPAAPAVSQAPLVPGASARTRPGRRLPAPLPVLGSWLFPVLVLVGGLVAVGAYFASGDRVLPPEPLAEARDVARDSSVEVGAGALPVPTPGEVALARARAAVSHGNLKEALRWLDSVAVGDSRRADADRLRAEVQRTLLSVVAVPGASSPSGR